MSSRLYDRLLIESSLSANIKAQIEGAKLLIADDIADYMASHPKMGRVVQAWTQIGLSLSQPYVFVETERRQLPEYLPLAFGALARSVSLEQLPSQLVNQVKRSSNAGTISQIIDVLLFIENAKNDIQMPGLSYLIFLDRAAQLTGPAVITYVQPGSSAAQIADDSSSHWDLWLYYSFSPLLIMLALTGLYEKWLVAQPANSQSRLYRLHLQLHKRRLATGYVLPNIPALMDMHGFGA